MRPHPGNVMKSALVAILACTSHSFHLPASYRTAATPKNIEKCPISVNTNSFHRMDEPSVSPSTTKITSTSTQLEASSSLLAAASSPVGAFLVLTGIVLVHECGHYLAARSYGIKVEEFAIGFGPKVVGFEAFGNEFNFRAFPLGGYVRFPENYNITLVQEQQRELRELQREQRQQQADAGVVSDESNNKQKKMFGYELLNLLLLDALERERKKKEEEAAIVKQQQEAKSTPWWQFGGGKKSIPPPPQASVDPDELEIEYYDDPDLLQNRPWFQRAVVLSGGVVFNLLLAFSIYFGEITTSGLPQPVFDQGIMVTQNPTKEAAANGILRKGDVVIGVNGNPLAMMERPTAAVSQKAISDFISTIRATPDGESLQLSVLRNKGSQPVDLTIEPRRIEPSSPKTIGVILSPNFVKTELLQVDNPVEAVAPAAKLVSSITKETALGLLAFFGQLITLQDTGGQQVSGPIGLIKTGSEVVSTQQWSTVLAFAAAISINLGVVNAFPLPALDGGQLVFVLAEAITGKKVDQRLQEEIIGITVLLLIFVSVSAALGDVQNLLLVKK